MKLWLSMKGLLWIVLTVIGAVMLTGALVAGGYGKLFVPSPKNTGVNFVRSLAAHRYEGALQQISSRSATRVTREELQTLVLSFEASHQRIDKVEGISEEISGDTASVEVEVTFEDGTTRTMVIPLQQENGLWKVSSIEPFWNLIHRYPGGKIVTL